MQVRRAPERNWDDYATLAQKDKTPFRVQNMDAKNNPSCEYDDIFTVTVARREKLFHGGS
jgi:hypothetical protein